MLTSKSLAPLQKQPDGPRCHAPRPSSPIPLGAARSFAVCIHGIPPELTGVMCRHKLATLTIREKHAFPSDTEDILIDVSESARVGMVKQKHARTMRTTMWTTNPLPRHLRDIWMHTMLQKWSRPLRRYQCL